MRRRRFRAGLHGLAVLAWAAAVGLAACDTAATVTQPAPTVSQPVATTSPVAGAVRIAAATSLTDAFNAMTPGFERANPTIRPSFTFGPSATLSALAQAGGADLFAADDLKAPQEVVANRKAAGPAAPFASAPVVLIVAPGNPAKISAPLDLRRPGVRIAGLAAGSALAEATDQVVAKLAGLPGYPADYAAAIQTNTKVAGDDARALVAMVGVGEADAAFVFAGDARTLTTLEMVQLPDGARVSSRLGVVILATAADREAASAFVRWITGPEGQATLLEYGFGPPGLP